MFRNHYDTDITTWSPAGRLYQIEYAMETVKQGAPTVGCKSNTHVVLAALKRSPTAELSSYQEKVFKLDEHVGMSVTGLISDARYLARYIRTECMNHEYMQGTVLPISRLAETVASKHHRHTQSADKRPFGVGLLLAGCDENGPKLFQTSPSGDIYDFKACAIGARSQSARTYLEKHFTTFPNCSVDELVNHALKALASTAGEGTQLNTQNTSIAIVGVGYPFTVFTDEAARKYLNNFRLAPEDIVAANDGEGDAAPGDNEEVPMDVEE
jgi:20S proteasome subunit alpha 6